ncbi:MAG: hypothetical protein ACHQVS_01470 [Candidatus Babeliales bacterium]
MVSVKIVQQLITALTLLLAYFLVISPVGYFRAWVSRRMGDTTGEDLGFLTLNPIPHIDFVGILVLFFFGVGWGKHIPINPMNITYPYRWPKLLAAYFSDTFAHMVLATLALLIFITIVGPQSLGLYATAQISSLSISLARIIIAFINLNIFLAAISLVINAVMLIGLVIAERNVQFPPYFFYFIILAPIVVLLLFGESIRYLMLAIISTIGNWIAHLLGAQ